MSKQDETRRIKRDGRVNSAKSTLLAVARDLDSRGLARDAKSLRNMICRLEDWQNRA